MKTKIFIMEKKKIGAENVGWAIGYCPTVLQGLEVLYCEQGLYCSLKRKGNYIARLVLYCNRGRLAKDCIAIHQVVLQVERGLGRDKCIATRLNDIGHCIAIQ